MRAKTTADTQRRVAELLSDIRNTLAVQNIIAWTECTTSSAEPCRPRNIIMFLHLSEHSHAHPHEQGMQSGAGRPPAGRAPFASWAKLASHVAPAGRTALYQHATTDATWRLRVSASWHQTDKRCSALMLHGVRMTRSEPAMCSRAQLTWPRLRVSSRMLESALGAEELPRSLRMRRLRAIK